MTDSFFKTPTLELSKRLLGAELIHETAHGPIGGTIVEVEAYLGPEDRAAHSYGGRRTKRTEVMFGPPGRAYLYKIYGMHVCLNVVSGPIGKPEAVLIRALEPTYGIEKMIDNRGIHVSRDSHGQWRLNQLKGLTNGPGKLVKALALTMDFYNHDLAKPPLTITPPEKAIAEHHIGVGPRIGIDNTGEARAYPYRFWIKGHPFVSR
ncbi:DNA-3-methyladenine glycosylase [Camelliibacillus cellulosilyticus]|uniref:Putative 3-methyladenine DNA glycosylase n=1 Tax=Camelliibacillus cellulosilyticus TaxID=2174486 RepID=A0ABV9GL68_9BACL